MRLRDFILLAIIVLASLVFSYPYHQGISPFDPAEYLKYAVDLLHGKWNVENVFGNRIGTYAPIALVIKLFGFSPKLTWISAFELEFFVITLYLLLRRYNKVIAFVSAALIAWIPDIVVMSGQLMGDVLTMSLVNLCLLWVWYTRSFEKSRAQIVAGIFLSIIWYTSFLVKESAFFYLIPLLLICLRDLSRKRRYEFWAASIATGAIAGCIFLAFYYLKTGDFLYRLHNLEVGPNISESNYALAPYSEIVLRLTLHPIKFLVENFSYFIVFFLSLLQVCSKPRNANEIFFNFFVLSVLACWWLGTQSFLRWNPVALISRIWLPLMVPLAISSAHVIYYIYINETSRYKNKLTIAVFLALLVTSLLIPFLNQGNVFWLQNNLVFVCSRLGFLLIFFVLIYKPMAIQEFVKQNVVFAILFMALFYYNIPVVKSYSPSNSQYLAEKEIVNMIARLKRPLALIVEDAIERNHGIYDGFISGGDSSILYVSWEKIDEDELQKLNEYRTVYLMVNNSRIWYMENDFTEAKFYAFTARKNMKEKVPAFVLKLGRRWRLLHKNSHVSLYRYLPPPPPK